MSNMTAQTHLHKVGSTYYFRRKVPVDLRSIFGKEESKHSLKTKNFQVAKRLVRQASVEFDRKCQAARAQISSQIAGRKSVLDESTVQGICELWRCHALAGDEYGRQQGLSDEEFAEQAAARQKTEDALKHCLARGQHERVEPALRQFLALLNVDISGDAEAWQRFRYRFLQALTETHGLQRRRDEGEVVRTPEPPSQPAICVSKGSGLTWEQLFEDWRKFEPNRPERTLDDVRLAIKEFQETIGNKPVDKIVRQDILLFRDNLVGRGLRPKTVDKKLSFLRALFYMGIESEKLTVNPAQRIRIAKGDKRKWIPFDHDDLLRIFGSPLYTRGEELGRKVGKASAWLPLLSLYQGCRVEELAQLLIEDIQKIDGVWCLIIDDILGAGGDAKRVKNDASRRRLPLHPAVIDAGFVRFVERLRSAGSVRVFKLKADRYAKFSSGYSKAFMKYLRKDLGITHPQKVFHSFRHNFRDACREAKLDEEISDALMGHTDSGRQGRDYGSDFPIRRLQEEICKIKYPGLVVPIIVGGDSPGGS